MIISELVEKPMIIKKKGKIKMKNEYGRSMIEMLGVLAIIGVLSIGGLAGYTMAMNRHRANQILDYVSRCAVAAQTNGDGYYIGKVVRTSDGGQGFNFTVSATNCGELLPLENAPNAMVASDFVVSSANPGDLYYTIETPLIASQDIRSALLNRDNVNVIIREGTGTNQKTTADSALKAGSTSANITFTFKK